MSGRHPGVVVGLLVLAWGPCLVSPATGQWGIFGLTGDAGPDAGPRKILSNPWRVDAGPPTDSGDFLGAITRAFQGTGGGGAGFLRERAPAIADLVDSDGGILPGGDGGGFSFELPDFGADLDAGARDVGPVVKPVVKVARPREDVRVLTSPGVPPGLVWARLPGALQEPVKAAWGVPLATGAVGLTSAAVSPAGRETAWQAVSVSKGWGEGAAAFLLDDVGRPVPARLVALGVRPGEGDNPAFYAGFVAPRDKRQPLAPRVVLAASGNVGPGWTPQPPRPALGRAGQAAVQEVAQGLEVPFGRARRPRVGPTRAVWSRVAGGTRWDLHVTEARPPNPGLPLCFEMALDGPGRVLSRGEWSPVCDHHPVAAVDVDGDGLDEVVWREGPGLVLRRHPGGEVVDQDPPGGL